MRWIQCYFHVLNERLCSFVVVSQQNGSWPVNSLDPGLLAGLSLCFCLDRLPIFSFSWLKFGICHFWRNFIFVLHLWISNHDLDLQISFADYNLLDILDNLVILSPPCLDAFPTLKAYYVRMTSRPNLKKYRESEAFKKIPVNDNGKQ